MCSSDLVSATRETRGHGHVPHNLIGLQHGSLHSFLGQRSFGTFEVLQQVRLRVLMEDADALGIAIVVQVSYKVFALRKLLQQHQPVRTPREARMHGLHKRGLLPYAKRSLLLCHTVAGSIRPPARSLRRESQYSIASH